MPISLSLPPRPFHFTRNQIAVEIEAPDKFATPGVAASRHLTFSTYPINDGDELTIAWERDGIEKEAAFTFQTTPDANEYELLKYPGSNPLGWLTTIVAGLQGHPDLDADWILAADFFDPLYGIRFLARYQEEESIAITVSGYTAPQVQVAAGVAPVANANYRLSVWPFVSQASESGNSAFTRLREIELDANADGVAQLDVQRYMDAMIDEVEPTTNTTGGEMVRCDLINRQAYLVVGQKWGDPLERKKQVRTDIFRLVKGGVQPRKYPAIRAELKEALQARFLTNRTHRRVLRTSIDWLFWVAQLNEGRDYRIAIRAFRTDGGSGFNTIPSTEGLLEGRTYQFRSDYVALNVALFELQAAAVYKYEVSIRDFAENEQTGDPITEWVTYLVEDSDYLDVFFDFENSLGAIERIKMNGPRELLHQLTKQGYRKPLPHEHGPGDTGLLTYGEESGMVINCSTGPMNTREALGFVDFLHARHRWVIIDGERIRARVLNAEALAERFDLDADYTRGGEFAVEIGMSKNV